MSLLLIARGPIFQASPFGPRRFAPPANARVLRRGRRRLLRILNLRNLRNLRTKISAHVML